jgi:hypothetical protein
MGWQMILTGPRGDRLDVAIASGSEGPVFFKLVGPTKAIDGARSSFAALVNSLHVIGAK